MALFTQLIQQLSCARLKICTRFITAQTWSAYHTNYSDTRYFQQNPYHWDCRLCSRLVHTDSSRTASWTRPRELACREVLVL